MKLFISWSGERSKALSEGLRDWIPNVINAVEPWISSSDIAPGTRWGTEVANQLEKTSFGIICLTRENLTAPWILFEAGALSKFVANANVVPFLLDNKLSEIQGPLAQFQALQVSKNDINKLLVSINKAVALAGEKSLNDSQLTEAFDVWWSKLEQKIDAIPNSPTPQKVSTRTDREVLDEILLLLRGLNSKAESTLAGNRTAYSLEDYARFFLKSATPGSVLEMLDRPLQKAVLNSIAPGSLRSMLNKSSVEEKDKLLRIYIDLFGPGAMVLFEKPERPNQKTRKTLANETSLESLFDKSDSK
jgi:hypothetical protein